MGQIKNVKVIDETKLQLLEDCNSGDYIDLMSINKIDASFIQKLINNEKENQYKLLLNEEKKKWEEFALSRLNEKLSEQKLEFNNKLSTLESQKTDLVNKLNNEIELLKKGAEKDIQISLSNQRNQFSEELNKKELEISKLKNELSFASDVNKLQKEKEIAEITKELNEKFASEKEVLNNNIEKIKEEYDRLKLSKSLVGIKDIGENLEVYCDTAYKEASITGFQTCTWKKDNDSIKEDNSESKGTKADFIFKVYATEERKECDLLTSVIMDMKDENPLSTSKKKNEDYFATLDKNRKKKGCEYALLVSTLETNRANSNSTYYKVSEYEKMYVVRPQYLMLFLSLITALAMKYSSLLQSKAKEELEFKEKQDILNDFENFKSSILDRDLTHLADRVDKISKSSSDIITKGENIKTLAKEIIDIDVSRITNKINNFKINRLVDKITKLD